MDGIDLYWLPLGAGGSSVRLNGRAFEAVQARVERRAALDLYHSALEVCVPEGRFVIELAPIPRAGSAPRGVVGEGAVGSPRAGRWRIFRYELRRWAGGAIPDVAWAVESPQRLSDDAAQARRLLDLVEAVPLLTWGRDELGTGEMWTCNSIVSWLLAAAGLPLDRLHPPAGGRAPGWDAGAIAGIRGRPSLERCRS
jgi:hypothetical protein